MLGIVPTVIGAGIVLRLWDVMIDDKKTKRKKSKKKLKKVI